MKEPKLVTASQEELDEILRHTKAHLSQQQYQLLQIDTPPVAPEELRAAARFQIREMVNVHIDGPIAGPGDYVLVPRPKI